jgi:hypothetical protein
MNYREPTFPRTPVPLCASFIPAGPAHHERGARPCHELSFLTGDNERVRVPAAFSDGCGDDYPAPAGLFLVELDGSGVSNPSLRLAVSRSSRLSKLRTGLSVQTLPPCAVRMPRAVRAAAIAYGVVMPLARISAIIGASARARASARAIVALRAAARACGVTPGASAISTPYCANAYLSGRSGTMRYRIDPPARGVMGHVRELPMTRKGLAEARPSHERRNNVLKDAV